MALLLVTRTVRMFAYGGLSVVLALYLAALGFSLADIGLLLTLTLAGDAVISLWLATVADRLGRRRTLVIGAALMAGAGAVFATARGWSPLALAAIVGVISPTGKEIGPFLSIEQAALADLVDDRRRTHVFARYHLAASLATAAGALTAGLIVHALQRAGLTALASYRTVFLAYAAAGAVLAVCFLSLSPGVEARTAGPARRLMLGLHRSRPIVMRLSALFALDAFAGGFIVQSLLAYWFRLRFGVDEAAIGGILFGVNLLAGVSALGAAWLAQRIGLVNTMVMTHVPSNLLLCLVPLMPTLPLAVGALLVRFSISQMDVPTRQSYTMALVDSDERSGAAGVTTIARSIGGAAAPAFAGVVMGVSLSAPFFVAGGLKLVYDGLLYRGFRRHRAPEETRELVDPA
ncbi:MAG: MFS transporter [Betaproteobacteria bacterium]